MDLKVELEKQVESAYQKNVSRHGMFIHDMMKEMGDAGLSPSITGTAMIMILTDGLAKLNSMLTATFNQDIEAVAENAAKSLKETIKTYHAQLLKDIGGHNVHADHIGKEVLPGQPNG